jgi:hypothetical protein
MIDQFVGFYVTKSYDEKASSTLTPITKGYCPNKKDLHRVSNTKFTSHGPNRRAGKCSKKPYTKGINSTTTQHQFPLSLPFPHQLHA